MDASSSSASSSSFPFLGTNSTNCSNNNIINNSNPTPQITEDNNNKMPIFESVKCNEAASERYIDTKVEEPVDDDRLNSTELELKCFLISPQDLTPEPAVRKKEKSRKKRQPRLPVEFLKQKQQHDSSYYHLSHTDSDECADSSDVFNENKRKRDTRSLKKKMDSISGQRLKHTNSRFSYPPYHIKETNLKEFHENFSTLIRLGRFSNSNELKEHEQHQKQCNELIWRNIQAWYNNVSLAQQDEILAQNREKIPGILEEIMNFNLKVDYGNDANTVRILSNVSKEPSSRSCRAFALTPEIVNAQKYALKRVSELLDKLDFCERQYPTTKALGLAHSLYNREDFVYRVKSLCLWLSITRELCHKIRLLGRVLQQNQNELTDWPWLGADQDIEKLLLGSYESEWAVSQAWRGVEGTDSNPLSDITEIKSTDINAPPSSDEHSSETSISTSTSSLSLNPSINVLTLSRPEVKFNLSDSERSSRAASPSPTANPTSPPLNNNSPKVTPSSSFLSCSNTPYENEITDESQPKISFYHSYVDRSLKKMGMHKLMKRLLDLLDGSLRRAQESLSMCPKNNLSSTSLTSNFSDGQNLSSQHLLPASSLTSSNQTDLRRSTSLIDHGTRSKQFQEMGLPSFCPSFLFLLRVLLDVVYECFRLRLEQRPAGEPSALSVRQLIRECKDVLRGGIYMKQFYQKMVSTVVWETDTNEADEVTDLEKFDKYMKEMLAVYFNYLQHWMSNLQNLPDASHSLKNTLEEEWAFTKIICPHVIGGEAEAGKRFSAMASSLLVSIMDFLDSGIDEFYTQDNEEYRNTKEEKHSNENSVNNNLVSDHNQSEVKMKGKNEDKKLRFKKYSRSDSQFLKGNHERSAEDSSGDKTDEDVYSKDKVSKLRHRIQQTFRDFKNLFREGRERSSKALGFAKMLRKDLEIAAAFKINISTVELLQKLKETKHIRITVPPILGYMIFIPERILSEKRLILQLLNVTCGKEDYSPEQESYSQYEGHDKGYLLMMQCDDEKETLLWEKPIVAVDATAQTAIALSHIAVDGLMMVVTRSSLLPPLREEFSKLMGKSVHIVQEQISCHQAIAESLAELKETAMNLRTKIASTITQLSEKLYFVEMNKMDYKERSHLLNLYCVTIYKGYNFGFEYHKELQRLVSDEQKAQLGKSMIRFATDWMKFVMDKWEKGRGRRPTWAQQGMEFLVLVCEPEFAAQVTEEEFADLTSKIRIFLQHLVGGANTNPRSPSSGYLSSPEVHGTVRFPSAEETRARNSSISYTPPISADSASKSPLKSRGNRHSRIIDAINELENERNKKLQMSHIIGYKTDRMADLNLGIRARRVNFRWQRGIKIGEGTFGKVYTAVNVDTGELMAMKEMKLKPSDKMKNPLKGVVDEMKNLEGINHPNLVKYYGVEVQKDEMIVFMEYCDRGTIEEASKLGLPESMIRMYTREILKALSHLHDHGIVHRDLKGANVFLTSNGSVKLGDFGCSVKLKNQSTVPGEICDLVGTHAYMAPEVFSKNDEEGHGRAADIWSLGCVVLEMATGKRPWHELYSYQIMFMVGMGNIPVIPDHLSSEGKSFLENCLQTDPSLRMSANDLLNHPFPKVSDEDMNLGEVSNK